MNLQSLEGKKILIVGYGKEGHASEAFLRNVLKNPTITMADAQQGPDYLDRQREYDIAIKSPGIKKELVSIPYLTATNIFFSLVNKRNIIGVTGSKGKSTTSSLIHQILLSAGKKSHLVGNIGKPMLSELMHPIGTDDVFVCELSSYQLCDIEYSPHIAVITSLFPDHMSFHGDLDKYYASKFKIIEFSLPTDFYVYNPVYKLLKDWASKSAAQALSYEEMINLTPYQNPLLGDHNVYNIRAATTVARLFNIDDETIKSTVSRFKPLPHRLEHVGTYQDIDFYDDAISTTPESTIAAIRSLKNISVIMLGGEDRGYDFGELAEVLAENKVPNIILFPHSGAKIKSSIEAIANLGYNPKMIAVNNMRDAVDQAYKQGAIGSICLLSCASPSYSLWKNFEQKGDEFSYYVKQLNHNEKKKSSEYQNRQ